MVLGAKEILDEAKQPGDFLWELVPLWSSAQPGSLPGNNFAAEETFLLDRHSLYEESKPAA